MSITSSLYNYNVESNRIPTPRGFCLCRYAFQLVCYRRQLEPCATPALVGNVVVWKPSPAATLPNYIVHHIFTEADVPPGAIQFVPGPLPEAVAQANKSFAARSFTRSTFVFKKIWKDIAANLDKHKGRPRVPLAKASSSPGYPFQPPTLNTTRSLSQRTLHVLLHALFPLFLPTCPLPRPLSWSGTTRASIRERAVYLPSPKFDVPEFKFGSVSPIAKKVTKTIMTSFPTREDVYGTLGLGRQSAVLSTFAASFALSSTGNQSIFKKETDEEIKVYGAAFGFGGGTHLNVERSNSSPGAGELVAAIQTVMETGRLRREVGVDGGIRDVMRVASEHAVLTVVDFPLRVLSMIAQIRCGLWVCNGFAVRGQLLHYRDFMLS
ncbi:hypothetical protein F5890DRAFT_1593263 [Lentinula detonsa]|uniref:Aldehyde dehydrogenase domain-containing protein n=1 Tax=Lentinula detonsa TaxID=2804962 RepID=A0AA38ULB5_9AGAR|nr:hypothetical protein F5890DRAFT_1593263 [Lentinula detonsa]